MKVRWLKSALPVVLTGTVVSAINLDVHNDQSLKDAAANASYNAMTYYKGNQTGRTPGKLPDDWWQGAILFDTMIRYWHFTGDGSNNAAVSQGMYHQAGDDSDYMSSDSRAHISNVDQAYWGLAAITAAELDFPAESKQPAWADLAQNVFDKLVYRWDKSSCKGGLRWQIWPYQAGYTKKTASANGALFQLSARLAHYTGNKTHSDWAETVWHWSKGLLVDEKEWKVADNVANELNCNGSSENTQWTANYAMYLGGAAYMYNVTDGQKKWKEGTDGLLNTTLQTFFPKKRNGAMSEVACEVSGTCDPSMQTYKAILSSNLASIAQVAPYTAEEILPKLQDSATAAAKHSTEDKDNSFCGLQWYESWDDVGRCNVGKQISATSLFSANLVAFKDGNNNSTTSAAADENGAGTMGGTRSWAVTAVVVGVVSLMELVG
ncbi:hypothetical protein N8T08_010889 [Aspergillus melleus]|uniref:Uncharacterized protein n=1 Tax=Aspergillus melleus TaxID=138277 RepID=A0ACC3AQN2_9EURO|nr:hypothetical protein N8T08_010889 [Aspergillus melleus]